jgi:hypothetical protein
MAEQEDNLWGRPLGPSESIRLSLDLEKASSQEEKMEVLAELFFGFNQSQVLDGPVDGAEPPGAKGKP